jgi:hypothetical protein
MEQMMNHLEDKGPATETGASSWRSVGSVAAAWAARVEAQRQAAREEAPAFVPVAWAAE